MKPSLSKGTRDFKPSEVKKRNYIFDIIKSTFEVFGYQAIETPAMEKLTTLTGKYGDEGDKLLFKVMNNGDFLSKVDDDILAKKDSLLATSQLSSRGLRYDLTVPFARYVAMNQNDISFPFKRYQIQPVWRADRPQRGRYQEFYQCDVDVVGSNSLMYEAELVQIYDRVFTELNLSAEIHVNNRKVLEGMAEAAGVAEQFVDVVTLIDNLDKMGVDKVKTEMAARGVSSDAISKIFDILDVDGLDALEEKIGHTEVGSLGIKELRDFHTYLDLVDMGKSKLKFDMTLARGLSYYTGCIFEVKVPGVEIGSIGGGGRYDNLTETFGLKNISGVGVSFGMERIYIAMEELGLFPEDVAQGLDVFVIGLDDESHIFSFQMVDKFRRHGIRSDVYPIASKMNKMMKYANAINVPYLVVIGDQERDTQQFKLKNMLTGAQVEHNIESLIAFFDSE